MTHGGHKAAWVFSLAVMAGSCGSRDKPVEPASGFAAPSAGYADAAGQPDAAGAEAGAPAGPASTGDAGAADLSTLVSGALAQGAAVIASMGASAGSDPLDNGLKSVAGQQAPGMKPDAPATKMTLGPGAHGEASVTLRPGKCYTIVAFGNLGVQKVAIRLLPPPPAPPQPLFEGVTSGPTATIGAKDQCIRSPGPAATPLKLDVEMKQGQGQVGVQAYSK